MLRDTNKQRIFHDDMDDRTFLEGLGKYKALSGFQVYAWCLMPNHLHLLLRESKESEPIEKIMRRLGTWYVYHCNRRYERSSPLLEGRYKSEAVEDDSCFMTVLRYIHRNPVKAGMVSSPELYPSSSYASYFMEGTDGLADKQALFALVPKEDLAAWHQRDDRAGCLDVADRAVRRGISDEKAVQLMRRVSGADNLEAFARMPDKHREITLQRMRKAGASLNQIVRLTGNSMAIVRKAVNQEST